MKLQGWLLDASVDRRDESLTLWIKVNGKTHGYRYRDFLPSVFVTTDLLDSPDWSEDSILQSVQEHPNVVKSVIVDRFVSVYDEEPRRVLQVFVRPGVQEEVARELEGLPGAVVFHSDIDPVQQFFISNDIFPFGRVEFEAKEDIVSQIRCLERREDTEYETPPLEEVSLDVFIDSKCVFPRMEDPIHHIELTHNGEVLHIEEQDEQETLLRLQREIDRIDPDVIVTRGGDEDLFRYLTMRCRISGVDLVLSRDGTPLRVTYREPSSFWQYNQVVYRAGNQVMFNGRIHIDRSESLYYSPSGMAGIIEGCRLALVQPQRTARMSIGSINAAIQFYNAHKMGILIPPIKRNPEFLKSITDLATIDRGGLILQPEPGIYENVAECDFSSMYPTLMVTRNISPETICMREHCPYNHQYCIEVPGVGFRLCTRRRGIVAQSLELVIKKRREFKKLMQQGHDAEKYGLMENTLKGVLVSCFGYLGFKNAKFGRVEAHTAVTALARDVLLKTQEIGESMGLELIHGIVDSVWLKCKGGISYSDVAEFCKRVTSAVNIDMSPKGIYRWMVIPSSRLHSTIAPLNRYYGVYRNGAIKTRGIEVRRRDTCLFVGDCQETMIKTLAHGRDKKGFIDMIPRAYAVCQSYIDRLRLGDVDLRDLVLHSRLTRNPQEYRAVSRTALVAQQLLKSGRELHAGQKVRYLLVQPDADSTVRRVTALELFDSSTRYDPEAYGNLCMRAFESLIPVQYLNLERLNKTEPSVCITA